jgi:hypothetical protein
MPDHLLDRRRDFPGAQVAAQLRAVHGVVDQPLGERFGVGRRLVRDSLLPAGTTALQPGGLYVPRVLIDFFFRQKPVPPLVSELLRASQSQSSDCRRANDQAFPRHQEAPFQKHALLVISLN